MEPITYDKDPVTLIRQLLRRIRDDISEVQILEKPDVLLKEIVAISISVEEALKDGSLDEFVKFWEYDMLAATAIQPDGEVPNAAP